ALPISVCFSGQQSRYQCRAHEKETLLMFYAVPAPVTTRAPSPRQLPTDHVHAVPTREYQSDQSSRQLLRWYRLCYPNRIRSKLTNGNVFPLRRPSKIARSARTVLASKGSLRRAKTWRALDCSAPFRPASHATGGSDGNTSGSARYLEGGKAGSPP